MCSDQTNDKFQQCPQLACQMHSPCFSQILRFVSQGSSDHSEDNFGQHSLPACLALEVICFNPQKESLFLQEHLTAVQGCVQNRSSESHLFKGGAGRFGRRGLLGRLECWPLLYASKCQRLLHTHHWSLALVCTAANQAGPSVSAALKKDWCERDLLHRTISAGCRACLCNCSLPACCTLCGCQWHFLHRDFLLD